MAAEFLESELEGSVPDRFRRVAQAYPERPAVRQQGRITTYAALASAADAAEAAVSAALGRGSAGAALFCEPGPGLFAAMLGTLAAGGFYTPLDPRLPDARLEPILRELEADRIVTDAAHAERARRLAAASRRETIVVLDGRAGEAARGTGRRVGPDDLAYVLFTSGSTGKPKGVMQSHRNVLHNVRKLASGLRIVPDDRIALLTSPSFGASVSDIYGALLNGACVCPFDLSGDGLRRLPAFLEEAGITILHCVPSVFRTFASTLDGSEDLSRLRMLKLGGEPVLASDFDLYRNRFARTCVFHVGYGATEIHVIRQWFAGHDTPWPGGSPLGYAVDGTEVVLLSESGDERSGSDEGEIGVVASTLAVGYWKDPQKTAEAFLPAPGRPGARLYRTGDLGRLLPDGCLLHAGRKDARVKVRGHRVETGEVEAALLAVPGVREAAVEGRPEGGRVRLTAWVAAEERSAGEGGTSRLRHLLAGRLPASMIPSRFVFLDALPRTASGKVDRAALPEPGASRPPLETPFREATGRAAGVAETFALVLGLERVGADDDFFDLGGDSLSAVELLAALSEGCGAGLSVADLLEAPTPSGLASRLAPAASAPSGLLLRLRAGSGTPVFVVPGGAGDGEDLFAARRIARLAGGGAPFFCLRSGPPPHPPADALAERGVAEIRRAAPSGPYVLVGDCMGGVLAFAMAQRLRQEGQRVALLALLDAPFPKRGRRLRAWLRAHATGTDRLLGRAEYFGRRLAYHAGVARALPDSEARWRYARRVAGIGARGLDRPPDTRRRESLGRRASYVASLAAWRPRRFDGTVHLVECAESRRRGYGNAWSARSAGSVSVTVPGRHEDFLLDHGGEVAAALTQWLEEIR